MIFTEEEFASEHSPLFTTARNQVSWVIAPMLAAVSVVVVLAMSETPVLKLFVVERYHLTTEPVCPVRLRLKLGWLP